MSCRIKNTAVEKVLLLLQHVFYMTQHSFARSSTGILINASCGIKLHHIALNLFFMHVVERKSNPPKEKELNLL